MPVSGAARMSGLQNSLSQIAAFVDDHRSSLDVFCLRIVLENIRHYIRAAFYRLSQIVNAIVEVLCAQMFAVARLETILNLVVQHVWFEGAIPLVLGEVDKSLPKIFQAMKVVENDSISWFGTAVEHSIDRHGRKPRVSRSRRISCSRPVSVVILEVSSELSPRFQFFFHCFGLSLLFLLVCVVSQPFLPPLPIASTMTAAGSSALQSGTCTLSFQCCIN